MAKIRVLLVDDHPIVRAGIRMLLDAQRDIEIVGESGDGSQVTAMVHKLEPDVLILDVQLPGMTGVEITRQLMHSQNMVKVLALSAYDDVQYIRNLLDNGAAGYLTKEEAPDIIVDAIHGVYRGENGWISERAASQMKSWRENTSDTRRRLTRRELEVLQEIVNGRSNGEIGHSLRISEKTVEKHVSSILAKLNVGSRVEAAVMSIHERIV